MDWDAIVSMVVPVSFFFTVGGVLVLRPIAQRLGTLLDAMAQEKNVRLAADDHRLREEVETLRERLEQLEERQDFAEGLISAGSSAPPTLGSGSATDRS